jgi:hypothetical protein
MKINQDMVNDVTYKHEKIYYKILCREKMTKSAAKDVACAMAMLEFTQAI